MAGTQAAFGRRTGFLSFNNSAIRIRLLVSTAAPTNTWNRSRPLARQRRMPRPRISTEMRPSMPTRNRWLFLNCGLRSKAFRSAVLVPPRLRNAYVADPRLPALLPILNAVEAAIARV
jgi:hypothetical protein